LFLDDINIGNTGNAPTASISSSLTNWLHCGGVNSVVSFSDASFDNPTVWDWSFTPNTVSYVNGSTSSDSSIDILFDELGIYQLDLNVSNPFGNDVRSEFVIVDSVVSEFIKPADTIYTGNTFSFFNNSFGADTWSWDFGDGGGSILEHATHMYSDTGAYQITLYAENSATGCNSTSHQEIIVLGIPTTGIIDFDKMGQLVVGPNPSKGIVSIGYDFSNGQNILLSVYNTLGQHLKQVSFYAEQIGAHQLNLSHLKSGLYFMELSIYPTANSKQAPFAKTLKLIIK
jgi:FOG: PKD repeat